MLLNFSIMKSRLFKPTLSCLNSTGPGLDSLIEMAINSISGLSTISARMLTMMSKVRFTIALKGSSSGVVRSWINLMGPMLSMLAFVGMTSL